MSRVHGLLNAWRDRFALAPHAKHVHAPLLDQAAVLDLLYRVEAIRSAAEYPREVAHRTVGAARAVYRGYGMDYEESRPYQAGDELRFMNWRLTARTGTPYMKVFREERRPGVFILIDQRAAMRFGTRVRLKVAQAARVAAVAAFSAQRYNAPVGGVLLAESPHWIPDAHGERGAFNLVNAARAPCPPTPPVAEADLGHVLKLMQALLVRGTCVYLISDFADLTEACRSALLQLATEHQVYAVHILDPAELRLPRAGTLRMHSGGHDSDQSCDTADASTRLRYETAAAAHVAACARLFTSLDIRYARVMTDLEAIEKAVPLAAV